MRPLYSFLFCLFSIYSYGQNQIPVITNLNVSLNLNESLSISYNLVDNEDDLSYVTMQVISPDGQAIIVDNAVGNVNSLVENGINKSITWDYSGILTLDGDYQIRLIADDQQAIDIQELVDQVDSMLLYDELSFIQGVRHRNTGLDHLVEVREHILQKFGDYNLNPTTYDFPYSGFQGENYVGDMTGTEMAEEVYILCGHYDTVSGSPGADDNGSSVVGTMEAIRLLSQYNFKKTIRFISFDLEEPGLVGSIDYVTNDLNSNEEIKGVLDLEMIGYATEEPNTQSFPTGFNFLFPDAYDEVASQDFKGNFIANIGKVDQNEWESAFFDAAATYVPGLRVINIIAPSNWQTVTPDLGRSDHAPFWVHGDPAVMLTGTANLRNPNYHTANDTIGSLNFTFMANVVKAAIATLAIEAEIQHSSIASTILTIDIVNVKDVNEKDIVIFPNPVGAVLHIETIYNIKNIEIIDIKGCTVLQMNTPTKNIDISTLKQGMYMLKTTINDKVIFKRFIK